MTKNSFQKVMFFIAGSILFLVLAPSAQAHIGSHEIGGFSHGLQHPMGGLDHILAMLAVGLWAAQLSGVALWLLPLSFVGAMLLGGVLGMIGITMPFVEQSILISDLVLGAVVLIAIRLPLIVSVGIVGTLAIFHGYAHGVEMPKGASGLEYAAGFVCSTALLHLAGLSLASLIQKNSQEKIVRMAGAGILLGALVLVTRSIMGS
jgi:urease accessory protein